MYLKFKAMLKKKENNNKYPLKTKISSKTVYSCENS